MESTIEFEMMLDPSLSRQLSARYSSTSDFVRIARVPAGSVAPAVLMIGEGNAEVELINV